MSHLCFKQQWWWKYSTVTDLTGLAVWLFLWSKAHAKKSWWKIIFQVKLKKLDNTRIRLSNYQIFFLVSKSIFNLFMEKSLKHYGLAACNFEITSALYSPPVQTVLATLCLVVYCKYVHKPGRMFVGILAYTASISQAFCSSFSLRGNVVNIQSFMRK